MIPASFTRAGYIPVTTPPKRRLMIGTAGAANSGKNEFVLSMPGPGALIALDRGYEGVFLNQDPPPERRPEEWAYKVIPVPLNAQAESIQEYVNYWVQFRNECEAATKIPELRVLCIDGDSDSYELQRLAEFGRLTGIFPQTKYAPVKAARRAFYNRLFDSGKTIICTNKVQDEYIDVIDPATGAPVMENGEVKRMKSGKKERQGFPDYTFLFQIQLMHLFEPGKEEQIPITPKENLAAIREGRTPGIRKTAPRWGIRIDECKPNMALVGSELWDEDCNFKGLVKYVFPHVPLTEWGFRPDEA